MRILLTGAIAGALIGAGLWALVRAFTPRRVALARIFADIDPAVMATAGGVSAPQPAWQATVGGWLSRHVTASGDTVDLAVAGRSPAAHALAKASTAIALALLPVAAGTVLWVAGTGVTPVVGIVPAVVMGVAGWITPDLEVRGRARRRREEFVAALSSYLDVVAIQLAGGTGVESALYAAADHGDGWPFVELRTALDRTRLSKQAPWPALEALGRRLQVDELVELATAAGVAGRHGAQIRTSLSARAAGLRARQLAEIEAAAGATTERMTIPLVILGVAFLAFILYPAVTQVLRLGS
jgi:Flp pilus assembly protein TadB